MTAARPEDERCTPNRAYSLKLWLFGQMQAQDAAGRSVLPRSRKTRGVLAVLALARSRSVLRTRLTGLLWSRREPEQARASLRQCVHELQRAIGPNAGTLLRADRNHLSLVDEDIWVDACVLDRATAHQPEALDLFRPALLDDLVGIDPVFDRWLAEENQRLTQHARLVAEAFLTDQTESATRIPAAERLLVIDRVHEGGWQALIEAHVHQGNRAAARVTFERCVANLSAAGLSPSRETEALLGAPAQRRHSATSSLRLQERPRGIRLIVGSPRALDNEGSAARLSGLAEEITAAVSRFRWISCATGSPSIEPGETALAGHVWQQQELDYLLDSTVQASGNRLRTIVRLLDVHNGTQVVWAQRFDRDASDALTLQDEIAGEVAAQIDPVLLLREGERLAARDLDEPTAHVLVLRAIPAIYRLEPSGFHVAGEMLAAALAVEPGNAAAHAWWAYWHLLLVGQGWAKDPVAATLRAGELAERAVTLDPCDARALALVGHVRGFLHKRAEEACALHDRALSLNPNLPLAWCFAGFAHSYLGRHEEAIAHITQAQRLSPHDPHAFFFDMALMMPHFLQGDFEKAVIVGRRAVELNPGCSSTCKGYLAALGHLRQDQESARVLARLLALESGFSIRSAIERSPMTRSADLALYAEGLRRAGLPES